jgi:hypothetical protein
MARWFGPKAVGWGVGPRGWQGWLVTAISISALTSLAFYKPADFGFPLWTRPALMGAVFVAYLALICLKYEPD